MLEDQFYTRLVLNVIIGIMFVYAMIKIAQYNNKEIIPQKHLIMKVFGWIFVGLSALTLVSCIITLVNVDFPSSTIGPFINPNMIVRPSSATLYWGYPTMTQNSALTSAMGVFTFLGFGGYFLFFRSSGSKWWNKILKFFTVVLLYAFMTSATNLHYFDLPEFIAPVLFIILFLVIINRKSVVKSPSFAIDVFNIKALQKKNQIDIHIEERSKESYGFNHDLSDKSETNDFSLQSDEPSIEQIQIHNTIKPSQARIPKISIKPYFWIGIFIILLGNLWSYCFEYLGIYISDAGGTRYEYFNSWNHRRVIYPTNDNDPALNFSSNLNRDDERVKPFNNRFYYPFTYSLNRIGQELWIYDLPNEVNTSFEKLDILRSCFEAVNWPINLVERWNDTALGEDAVSYYIEENGFIYHATVFIYKNHLGVVLSTGKSIQECEKLNEITLSKFSKFDYNKTHISIKDFKIINIIAWGIVLSILLLYVFKKVKSVGGFKSFINKQSRLIVILNICYVIGWFIFAVLLVLLNNAESDVLGVWGVYIPIWVIASTILDYSIKKAQEPLTEFYLFPSWFKNLLLKRNLNTKLVFRIILLFILWPIFYLCLVPVIGFIPCIYIAYATGILAIILCVITVFKWIKQGKGVIIE